MNRHKISFTSLKCNSGCIDYKTCKLYERANHDLCYYYIKSKQISKITIDKIGKRDNI